MKQSGSSADDLGEELDFTGISEERIAEIVDVAAPSLQGGQLQLLDLVSFTALLATGMFAFQFFSSTGGLLVTVLMLVGGLAGVLFLLLASQKLLGGQWLFGGEQTSGIVCAYTRVSREPGAEIQVNARYRAGGGVYEVAIQLRESLLHTMPIGKHVTVVYCGRKPHLARIAGVNSRKAATVTVAGVAIAVAGVALFYTLVLSG